MAVFARTRKRRDDAERCLQIEEPSKLEAIRSEHYDGFDDT